MPRRKLLELLTRNTKQPVGFDGVPGETYRCQATELVRASKGAESFPYVRDLAGNVAPLRFFRVVARQESARRRASSGSSPTLR